MANILRQIFFMNHLCCCLLPILHDSGDIPQPLHHGHGAAVSRPAQYTNTDSSVRVISQGLMKVRE